MTPRNRIILIVTATLCSALALTAVRAHDVPRVATGFVANVLCSETFVSGQDPDRIFSDTTGAMPGTGLIAWALDYKVDRTRRDVTVTLLGLGRSHAIYRDGLGCYLDHGGAVADTSVPSADGKPAQALLAEIAGPSLVAPANPQLAAALDRAFTEPDHPPFRRTKAVVVLKNSRIVAERYAEGYGIDKTIEHVLVGDEDSFLHAQTFFSLKPQIERLRSGNSGRHLRARPDLQDRHRR